MAYDAVGNMTSQINGPQNLEKEVHYNSQNRISRVVNPQRPNQLVGQYWYDDQGFRVRKLARFDRGQGNNLEDVEILYTSKFFGMEITSAFTAVNNIYLNGVRVAAVTPNGGAVYYLTDQVDSVKLILDDNKAEVSRLEYLPYGETFVQKGNKDYAPKYNSQELDPETKFYFYNARYYDPEVARFTSADSVVPDDEDTQAWNRFTYVQGNPIELRDPTGHMPTRKGDPANGFGGGPGGINQVGMGGAGGSLAGGGGGVRTPNTATPAPAAPVRATGSVNTPKTGTSPAATNPANQQATQPKPGQQQGVPNQPGSSGGLWNRWFGPKAAMPEKVGPHSQQTTLFRAVKDGELKDIQQSGKFQNEKGLEVKYFSETAEGAASAAKQLHTNYKDGPYTPVRTTIPTSSITPEMRASVDGGIPTVVVPTDKLPSLSPPQVQTSSAVPK